MNIKLDKYLSIWFICLITGCFFLFIYFFFNFVLRGVWTKFGPVFGPSKCGELERGPPFPGTALSLGLRLPEIWRIRSLSDAHFFPRQCRRRQCNTGPTTPLNHRRKIATGDFRHTIVRDFQLPYARGELPLLGNFGYPSLPLEQKACRCLFWLRDVCDCGGSAARKHLEPFLLPF